MNWRRWLRRDDREANLERELSFHIEERVADMVRSGVSEEDARRQRPAGVRRRGAGQGRMPRCAARPLGRNVRAGCSICLA